MSITTIIIMNTTISIPKDMTDELKEFGQMGETYEDVIGRLLKSAKERQLHDMLMDDSDSVPVRDALKRAKAKWQ